MALTDTLLNQEQFKVERFKIVNKKLIKLMYIFIDV